MLPRSTSLADEAEAISVGFGRNLSRRPQTTYELTGDGREQFEAHIDLLDGLIREFTDLGPSGDT